MKMIFQGLPPHDEDHTVRTWKVGCWLAAINAMGFIGESGRNRGENVIPRPSLPTARIMRRWKVGCWLAAMKAVSLAIESSHAAAADVGSSIISMNRSDRRSLLRSPGDRGATEPGERVTCGGKEHFIGGNRRNPSESAIATTSTYLGRPPDLPQARHADGGGPRAQPRREDKARGAREGVVGNGDPDPLRERRFGTRGRVARPRLPRGGAGHVRQRRQRAGGGGARVTDTRAPDRRHAGVQRLEGAAARKCNLSKKVAKKPVKM